MKHRKRSGVVKYRRDEDSLYFELEVDPSAFMNPEETEKMLEGVAKACGLPDEKDARIILGKALKGYLYAVKLKTSVGYHCFFCGQVILPGQERYLVDSTLRNGDFLINERTVHVCEKCWGGHELEA